MKKKLTITISAVLCAVILGFGIYKSDASPQNPTLSVDEVKQLVTSQYPGDIIEIELEKDRNKAVYEVEVWSQGREYELKLDGHSGEILNLKERAIKHRQDHVSDENADTKESKSSEEKDSNAQTNELPPVQITEKPTAEPAKKDNGKQEQKQAVETKDKQNEKPDEKKKENKQTVIDAESAIAIAQSQFSGTVTDLELDEDDGRLIYEIELESGNEEAEFEIDAYTGQILSIEIERDDD